MIEKLKPCPFCGKEATLLKPYYSPSYSVVCKHCDISQAEMKYFSEVDAVSAWNRRIRTIKVVIDDA